MIILKFKYACVSLHTGLGRHTDNESAQRFWLWKNSPLIPPYIFYFLLMILEKNWHFVEWKVWFSCTWRLVLDFGASILAVESVTGILHYHTFTRFSYTCTFWKYVNTKCKFTNSQYAVLTLSKHVYCLNAFSYSFSWTPALTCASHMHNWPRCTET